MMLIYMCSKMTAKTSKVGRPTKFVPEMVEWVEEYIGDCSGIDLGDVLRIPTIEGLARVLKIDTDTINDWVKHDDKKEFSVAIKKLKEAQKEKLMQLGLQGKYNPAMSIFLLKANHGMIETEKKQIEVSGMGIDYVSDES